MIGNNFKHLALLSLLVCMISPFALSSCKSEDSNKLPENDNVEHEILEIFKVEVNGSEKKPTTLSYKDIKYHRDGLVFRQDFFNVDNTLKGIELVTRENDKGISNYFAPDSTLLAIYHLVYDGDKVNKKSGYDGKSNALLRTEVYRYHPTSGAMSTKQIYDETGLLVRRFEMDQDNHGNETGVSVYSAEGIILAKETFEIVKVDAQNRWLEKWGSSDGIVKTFQRRSFK